MKLSSAWIKKKPISFPTHKKAWKYTQVFMLPSKATNNQINVIIDFYIPSHKKNPMNWSWVNAPYLLV